MKNFLSLAFMALVTFSVSLYANVEKVEYGYSIQIYSALEHKKEEMKSAYDSLPEHIKSKTVAYPSGKYITLKYNSSKQKEQLQEALDEIRNTVAKDAFIVKIFLDKYDSLIDSKTIKDKNPKEIEAPQIEESPIAIGAVQKQRLASQEAMKKIVTNTNQHSYSIQLYSFLDTQKNYANSSLAKLPQDIQSQSVIYPIGRYLTIRYLNKSKKKDLEKELKVVTQTYKDAFIVTVLSDKFKNYLSLKEKKHKPLTQEEVAGYTQACIEQQSFTFENLSNHEYTKVLLDAHKLKSKNETIQSIEMYERAFKHKQNNEAINNNLFYLYGKTNNWPKASEKLCLLKRFDKVLYSYSIGALEINNPMLEEELINYLDSDSSGYIHLALAVFFEKNEDFQKSHSYYKKAYDINRYDMYLAYAYGRSCEIQSNYKQALFVYNVISKNGDSKYSNLQREAYTRYLQINKLLQEQNEG